MRRPRDLDAELQGLAQRAKALKSRRIAQFGELVIATGADQLDPEVLAGALIAATKAPTVDRERWRIAGAAAFRKGRGAPGAPPRDPPRGDKDPGDDASAGR